MPDLIFILLYCVCAYFIILHTSRAIEFVRRPHVCKCERSEARRIVQEITLKGSIESDYVTVKMSRNDWSRLIEAIRKDDHAN